MVQQSVVEQIKQEIISGHLRPGMRLPPRTEFERRFQTTPNTIQRAFNRLAADGFIEAIPRRGTYVTAHPPHLSNYALLIYSKRVPGDWQNLFWDTLDRTARELSRTTDRCITVRPCIAPEFHSREYEILLEDIRARRLAGLVFCFDPQLAADTPLLDTPGLPAVSLAGQNMNLPYIGLNIAQFWRRALQVLAENGRRRLAVLCAPGIHTWATRYLPQLAAEHSVTLEETRVQSVDLLHPEWAENLAQLLLSGGSATRPDGLIVSDDNLLDPACLGLLKAGIRVPDDLEVVGLANYPLRSVDVLPVRRLGFDIRQLLNTAMDEIDRLRRGGDPSAQVWIPAAFNQETLNISRCEAHRDGPPETALTSPVFLWHHFSDLPPTPLAPDNAHPPASAKVQP